MLISNWIS